MCCAEEETVAWIPVGGPPFPICCCVVVLFLLSIEAESDCACPLVWPKGRNGLEDTWPTRGYERRVLFLYPLRVFRTHAFLQFVETSPCAA